MASLLLVRHGPDRGRIPNYLEHILDAVRESDPEVMQAVRDHRTGSPAPSLDDTRAVVFWLGDPLREWYPDCYTDASAIAREAEKRGIRIVNHPDALSRSVKSVQARLWHEAGIDTPSMTRFESREELRELLEGVRYPVVLRADEAHAQRGMRILNEAADLGDAAVELPGALAEFVDTRAGWRTVRPRSIWARLFHKKRAFVMGDIVRTNHIFFREDPIVSMNASTFRARHRPLTQPLRFLSLLGTHNACLRADYAYWEQETEHPELLLRAARALGLEFAAIDYSDDPERGPVLWEANPYFDLPRWNTNVLSRQRQVEKRFRGFHALFAEFFRQLLR